MLPDNPWMSLLSMVVIVALVIAMAYLFTRYVAGGHWAGTLGLTQKRQGPTVLVQTSIGKEQRLAVIQAGERYFLVGITPQNISMLAELSEEEISAWIGKQEEPERTQPDVPFQKILRNTLKREQKR